MPDGTFGPKTYTKSGGDIKVIASGGQEVVEVGGWIYESAVDSIVAFAGGGQPSAVVLTGMINRIITVASAADSVKLPASVAGAQITVVNNATTNAANVFPATGEFINQLAVNTAISLAANKTIIFTCVTPGTWHSVLSA